MLAGFECTASITPGPARHGHDKGLRGSDEAISDDKLEQTGAGKVGRNGINNVLPHDGGFLSFIGAILRSWIIGESFLLALSPSRRPCKR